MQLTKIDYVDFTANPVDGLCLHQCWYCYEAARRRRFHLKDRITFNLGFFDKKQADNFSKKHHRPARILVGSTHDIFGKWIRTDWIEGIINITKEHPEHIFLFLTKNPKRYLDFSFPLNCWLGQTVIMEENFFHLGDMENKKFISFEPLLFEDIGNFTYRDVDWFIIGGLTPKPYHTKECIDKILSQASYFNIPVFIKHNAHYPEKRQKFPKF